MRRRLLVMLDQAASSGSNMLVVVLVARSFASAEAFGAFSLAMIAYQLMITGVRSLVGDPFLSLFSNEPPSVRRQMVGGLLGSTLLLGLVSCLALWPLSFWLGGLSGEALLALVPVIPWLLIQDTWRYVFVVDRPAAALALDVLWLATVLVAVPLAPAGAGVTWFVLVWGAGGTLGAVLGLVLQGRAGGFHLWRWLVDHRDVGVRFLGESGAAHALGHVLVSALGAIAGLGALGAAKAAQVFYGPLNTLHAGIYMVVVPEGVALRDQRGRLRRKLVRVSVTLTTLVAGWMVVGTVVPGEKIFGGTWAQAEDLIVPMGLAAMCSAALSGAVLGLRSLADAKRSLRARLRATPWLAACPLIGAVGYGAAGFAFGTAAGTAVAAVIWWRAFHEALADVPPADTLMRSNGREPAPPPTPGTLGTPGTPTAPATEGVPGPL